MKLLVLEIFRIGNRIFEAIKPPPAWWIPVILMTSTFCGIGLLILHVSNATSYLSDDPKACINCHIMTPQYATWKHGSHGRITTCNDCHVPHDNIFRKYYFKAQDGMRHSFLFTFHLEPQVIRVHEAGTKVIMENCQRCHQPLLQESTLGKTRPTDILHGNGKLCWECHRETPHGRVNSLASVPNTRTPEQEHIIPFWIRDFIHPSSSDLQTESTTGKKP